MRKQRNDIVLPSDARWKLNEARSIGGGVATRWADAGIGVAGLQLKELMKSPLWLYQSHLGGAFAISRKEFL